MKVKTKIAALTVALALCGGALIGCGDDAPASTPKHSVRCSSDDEKYTVTGLQEKYEEGANVSFYVAEVDATQWKVTEVSSEQVTISKDSADATHYTFTMPTQNVTIRVRGEEVLQYTVTPSTSDIVVDGEVTFVLKLGTINRDVSIAKHEGETKECVINGNKVTFKEDGTYHMDFFDVDAQNVLAKSNVEISVRAQIPGEDPDNPVSSTKAFTWASTNLTPCAGESDANWGKTGYLSPKLYVTGKVISLENDPATDKNVSCTLEGGISTYHMGAKQSSGVNVADVSVGSIVTIEGYLYCYRSASAVQFGKSADKSGKSQFIAVDNSVLDSIAIPTEVHGTLNKSQEITANVQPYNGQTVEWEVSSEGVVELVVDEQDSRKATLNFVAEGEVTVSAHIGEVYSNDCAVSVTNKKQTFRPLLLSEIEASKTYKLAALDTDGVVKYAKALISNNYLAASANEVDAAAAELIAKEDSKYVIKLGDKYIGYQASAKSGSGYYNNILLKDTEAEAVLFTYNSTLGRFELPGKSSSAEEDSQLYFCLYGGSFRFSETPKHDGSPVTAFWGYADAVEPTAIELPATANVNSGSTITLKVEATPYYADLSEGVWSSADESIATVDQNGVVEGKSAGTVGITFTVGSLNKTCNVTVKDVSGGLPLADAGADFTGCKSGDTSLPAGCTWTYTKGGTLSFNNGGLKLSYTGATLTSSQLVSSDEITVTLKIGGLNENTKTAGEKNPIFTVSGLAEDGTTAIDTEVINNFTATGDISVTLEGTAMRYVQIVFNNFPYKSNGKNCNIRLDKITLA